MAEKKIGASKNIKTKKMSVVSQRIQHIINLLTDEQYLSEVTYGRLSRKIINALRVFIAAGKKFFADDCFTKASAIAYTTLLSLIPTLTVALTFYSVFSGVRDNKAEIYRHITRFMVEHNLQRLNINIILDTISSLIENAASIGSIGAIIMIFSATAVLRSLERSLNNIWNITRQRPIFLKIIYYWTALTLGPILLFAGTTLATQIQTVLTEPNYHSITLSPDSRIWLAGNKGYIAYNANSHTKFLSIDIDTIDFDNQKSYAYDAVSDTFSKSETIIDDLYFKKATFKDIYFSGKEIWVIGENGLILKSLDEGKTWLIEKWGSFKFNDIHMLSHMYGFIACGNGYLLKTMNGGKSWQIIKWPTINVDLNSIDFYGDKGIIAANKGYVFISDNKGLEWNYKVIRQARIKSSFVNLNHIDLLNEKHGWLVGDNGTILITNNGGSRWKLKRFKTYNYTSACITGSKTGYVAGENGVLLSTKNNGALWKMQKLPTNQINQLTMHNQELWAIGNAGFRMYSRDQTKSWLGSKGTSLIIYFLNFLAPFIIIWLLFLLTYIALPNTRIPFKPAAIGASLTGAIWVIFTLLFILYIKSFANSTFAIYGALAAIPIFLLILYASILIVLFGAEISYTLMYPNTYLKMRRRKKIRSDMNVYNGIKVLYTVYNRFESYKGPTLYKEITKLCNDRIEEADYFIDLFQKHKLLMRREGGGFIPTTSSKNIMIVNIIDLLHNSTLELPVVTAADPLRKYLSEAFKKMHQSQHDILKNTRLSEIIEDNQRT
jgi:membrane protein